MRGFARVSKKSFLGVKRPWPPQHQKWCRSGRIVFQRLIHPTFGSQLLWLAITFGVLYWPDVKIALPRLSDILEVRLIGS